ncbi:LytR/AlgR family response regulator transcription factor [Parapedobacter sp. GCM10030251]|uniref:LytR/AlgR family response regulator transcription factor n=1 Tax=Parapedobacter sp. GCM10030251 TaxID=3273419 RepID=UPI00361FF3C0
MYTCVIIDDEAIARDALAEYVAKVPFLKLLGCYENPLALMTLTEPVDIIFSDIRMPEMDGISFFRSLSNPPAFIFVTGNPEHAAESYELDVLDFVVKPFDLARFIKAVNKAKLFLEHKHGSKQNTPYFVVKDRNLHVILEHAAICFVKGNKDYVSIETTERTYTLWRTLGSVAADLPADRFLQVHKSYIVNLAFVKSIAAEKLILKGNLGEVPVGKQFKDELRRRFGIGLL